MGSYMLPRLVDAAEVAEVICISRGQHEPYPAAAHASTAGQQLDPRWSQVKRVVADREQTPDFVTQVVEMRPDVIIDMICFTPKQCKELVDAMLTVSPPLAAGVQLIHVGSIWAFGPSIAMPTTEEGPHGEPIADYGRNKRAIAEYLLRELKPANGAMRRTVLHPGHICGRGWPPLNPQGNFDPKVFLKLRKGESITLPNLGMETVHHVHADDVASAIIAAMRKPDASDGEAFNVVSPQALSLKGFAEHITAEIWPDAALSSDASMLEFLPIPSEAFTKACGGPGSADLSLEHVSHSPCCSGSKLERVLGCMPQWTSLAAVADAVRWMDEQGVLQKIYFPGCYVVKRVSRNKLSL